MRGSGSISEKNIHITSSDNFHITLVFLGYQEDGAILPIIRSMQDIASGIRVPDVVLDNISYAPPKGVPHMIWLNGTKETSKGLAALKVSLEDELIKNGVRFKLENRKFNSHITMARLVEIPKADLLEIDAGFKGFDWSFVPESIDLMESHLSGRGARYEVLQRIKLSED